MKCRITLLMIIVQLFIGCIVCAKNLHIQENIAKNESDSSIVIDLSEPWPHIMLDYYDTLTYVKPIGSWLEKMIKNVDSILPIYMRNLDCYQLYLKYSDRGIICKVERDAINDIYFCPTELCNSHFWGYSRLNGKYILYSGYVPTKLIKYNKKKKTLIIQSSKYGGMGHDYEFPDYKISSNKISHIVSRVRFTDIQQKALDMIAHEENIDRDELSIAGMFSIDAEKEHLHKRTAFSKHLQIESSINYNRLDSMLFYYTANSSSLQDNNSIKVSCSDINDGIFAIALERKGYKSIFYFLIKPNLDICIIDKRNM